jgi:hypothetical protein
MKKIVVGLLCITLLLVFLFFMVERKRNAEISPESFLPKNVLAYCRQKELANLIGDFQKSHMGIALAGINIIQTAKDLEFPPKDIKLLEKVMDGGGSFIKSPLFNELFGNDFALALLPENSAITGDPGEKIKKSLILIARPQHGAQLINLIASGFDTMSNQATEKYKAFTIRKFKQEGNITVSMATVGGFILISLNNRVIENCLDRYIENKPSLKDNSKFKKTRNLFKEPVFFGYLNLDLLSSTLGKYLVETNHKRKDILEAEIKKWRGMEAAGYGVWREQDRIKDKGVVILDDGKFDPKVKELYKAISEKNSTMDIVPNQVFGYYWTNTMDLQAYWKMYLSGANVDQKKVEQLQEDVQKQFGMSVEDILGMLDKQCGFMIQQSDGSKILPIPDFSFFVQIRNKKNFNQFYNKFLADSALSIKKIIYKGVDVTSIAGMPQGGFVRLYIIKNNYLVAATSMSMMRKIIDVMHGGAGLKDSSGFKRMNMGLMGKNNTVVYIRIGDLLETVKELANWGRALLAFKDQEDSRKIGVVMDQILNPLFDSLSMCSDFGLRSRFSPDMITIESTTLIRE